MKTESDLHPYQHRLVDFIVRNPLAALFVEMGLGKTISVLTAIERLQDHLRIHGVLVLAPVRVTELVWKQEAAVWEHTRHLRVQIVRARSPTERLKALHRKADIHVVNYEALPWLAHSLNDEFLGKGSYLPWDMLVLDESTRVKNLSGKRVKYLIPMLDHMSRRVLLTGTPKPNGYRDLFGQFYCLDKGDRLGRKENVFLAKWFTENQFARKWSPTPEGKKEIRRRVSDVSVALRAKDYLDLPEMVFNDIWVELPPFLRKQYDTLENEMFVEMDHGAVVAKNAAALTAKCRQLANGAIIDTETGASHYIHNAKLDALDEIMEGACGEPVLMAYIFRADAKRVLERLRARYRTAYLGPGVTMKEGERITDDWNLRRLDFLTTHPKSAGHGLNLQRGGHVLVWYGLDWNLEEWQQMNARLWRQGQTAKKVIVHRILAKDTVDIVVKNALQDKKRSQDAFMNALKDYRSSRKASSPVRP